MELIDFLREISRQHIVARDRVTVVTNDIEITGSLIPYKIIVSREGQTLLNIIHERDEQLMIIVKTLPDGMGPDIGSPVLLLDIVSITKHH